MARPPPAWSQVPVCPTCCCNCVPATATVNLDKYLSLVGDIYYTGSETASGDHDVRSAT